jgi:flagellar biosynthesis chaperone FliJ
MATCVCTDSADINADLQTAFEEEFYLSLCDDSQKRTYDQVLRDQLYITNALIDDLEEQIDSQPDLDEQLAEAEEQISTYWTNYEVEITLLIQNAQTALDNGAEESYSSDDLSSLLATLTAYSDR